MTNRKLYTCFQLVPKSTNLDVLERPLCTLFQNTCFRNPPRKLKEDKPILLAEKCSRGAIVSGNTRFMQCCWHQKKCMRQFWRFFVFFCRFMVIVIACVCILPYISTVMWRNKELVIVVVGIIFLKFNKKIPSVVKIPRVKS